LNEAEILACKVDELDDLQRHRFAREKVLSSDWL